MQESFPILDISHITEKYFSCTTWKLDEFKNDPIVKQLVDELSAGFSTWGFLYIKGHGIPQELIDSTFELSKEFFVQPMELKMKCRRGPSISLGYLPSQGEVFDENKPRDLKESFDFLPKSQINKKLSENVTDLVPRLSNLFELTADLMSKILRLLAISLDMDMENFVKLHKNVGDRSLNGTSMRMLYYPPVEMSPSEITPEHKRIGEHTDYGTLTLLYQDAIGGLEVKSPAGQFVKANPIPGTIVINAGDLLDKWSNGNFLATIHRVTVPTTSQGRTVARQSMAFFAHPDYEVNIETADGVENAYQHLKKRFDDTIVVDEDLDSHVA